MRKLITPRVHGMLDYATMLATAVAPRVLHFPRSARQAAYVMAGSYSGLSALTDYPLALRRVVPFRTHGWVDRAMGLAIPALPWVLGFSRHRRARNFFLGLTGVTMAVTALTDWGRKRRKPERR